MRARICSNSIGSNAKALRRIGNCANRGDATSMFTARTLEEKGNQCERLPTPWGPSIWRYARCLAGRRDRGDPDGFYTGLTLTNFAVALGGVAIVVPDRDAATGGGSSGAICRRCSKRKPGFWMILFFVYAFLAAGAPPPAQGLYLRGFPRGEAAPEGGAEGKPD